MLELGVDSDKVGINIYVPKEDDVPFSSLLKDSVKFSVFMILIVLALEGVSYFTKTASGNNHVILLLEMAVSAVAIIALVCALVASVGLLYKKFIEGHVGSKYMSGVVLVTVGKDLYVMRYSSSKKVIGSKILSSYSYDDLWGYVCSVHTHLTHDMLVSCFKCESIEVVEKSREVMILNFPTSNDYLGETLSDLILLNNFSGYREFDRFIESL